MQRSGRPRCGAIHPHWAGISRRFGQIGHGKVRRDRFACLLEQFAHSSANECVNAPYRSKGRLATWFHTEYHFPIVWIWAIGPTEGSVIACATAATASPGARGFGTHRQCRAGTAHSRQARPPGEPELLRIYRDASTRHLRFSVAMACPVTATPCGRRSRKAASSTS